MSEMFVIESSSAKKGRQQMAADLFIAIYEFWVHPGQESAFIKYWEIVTEAIYRHRGSLGSRLHREGDGKYIAYAQWPSEEAFESDIPLPAEALIARDLMIKSCQTTKLAHRLTVVADHLKSN